METIHRGEERVSTPLTVLLCLTLTVFLFQTLLENYIYAASYLDEALAALYLGFFVVSVLTNLEMRGTDLMICVLVVLVTAAGLYGNMRFQIQQDRAAVVLDIVSHFKFAAIYLGAATLARAPRFNWRRVIRIPALLAKAYLTVLFGFGVLNLFKDIGMHSEYRHGLRCYAFVFGTPGIVINTVLFIMMLLLMESAVGRENAEGPAREINNRGFLIMAIAVLLFVVKTRGLILAAASALLFESFLIEDRQEMRYRLGAIAAVGGILGFPQFQEYFVSGVKASQGRAPRLMFFEGGVQLFKEYFPFGTGFGTFGSSSAATHYSPLYYQLGFDKIPGMQPTDTRYLNDTFWPMIFGQLGLVGTIPFVILFFLVLWEIYRAGAKSGSRTIRFAVFLYVINVLFSSIQSAYPSNNSMVMLTFIVTLMSLYRREGTDGH